MAVKLLERAPLSRSTTATFGLGLSWRFVPSHGRKDSIGTTPSTCGLELNTIDGWISKKTIGCGSSAPSSRDSLSPDPPPISAHPSPSPNLPTMVYAHRPRMPKIALYKGGSCCRILFWIRAPQRLSNRGRPILSFNLTTSKAPRIASLPTRKV